jgi:hypothetical protein
VLYHFTNLANLPTILREGLVKGRVPLAPTDYRRAPNLTSNPNPRAQHWALGGATDKTKVRLSVRIPEGEPRLEAWRDVCRRLRVDQHWQRGLDPFGQGKSWFVFRGVMPPEWITVVDVRRAGGYAPCRGDELGRLTAAVEEELRKLIFVDGANGELYVGLKPGHTGSWLLDAADVLATPPRKVTVGPSPGEQDLRPRDRPRGDLRRCRPSAR